jgi:hypothetical protein
VRPNGWGWHRSAPHSSVQPGSSRSPSFHSEGHVEVRLPGDTGRDSTTGIAGPLRHLRHPWPKDEGTGIAEAPLCRVTRHFGEVKHDQVGIPG